MNEKVLTEVKNDISRQFGYDSFDELLKDNVLNRSGVLAVALDRTIDAIVKEYLEKHEEEKRAAFKKQ